jgi:hypothetical protein
VLAGVAVLSPVSPVDVYAASLNVIEIPLEPVELTKSSLSLNVGEPEGGVQVVPYAEQAT